MGLLRLSLALCAIVLCDIFQPSVAIRAVNISDAWLLSDAESPVFYRHFRDRVTWSEAEAICQFHHSVLATVRNTNEFDRTRALLRELNWATPVWVGLQRVLGQPMFKWSTPAGATLLPSDGYWYEAPNTKTSRALCVVTDPASDFRWRAIDCSSPTDLFSFICQIPVPVWARSEHGGCLSPRWPSREVTVQYLPQNRALEMTADCGLHGTRRIACKQHSTVDIRHMEHKLQCPIETTSVSGSATPPRPPTRHRRDTNPSTVPTPMSANLTTSQAEATESWSAPSSQQVITELTLAITKEVAMEVNLPTKMDVVAITTNVDVSVMNNTQATSEVKESVTPTSTEENVTDHETNQNLDVAQSKILKISTVPLKEFNPTTNEPVKKSEALVLSTQTESVENTLAVTAFEDLGPNIFDVINTTEEEKKRMKTEYLETTTNNIVTTQTLEPSTSEEPEITTINKPTSTAEAIVTTPKHPAYHYSKSSTGTSSTTFTPTTTITTTLAPLINSVSTTQHPIPSASRPQERPSPPQPIITPSHQLTAGTPRNFPSVPHLNSHPMVTSQVSSGVPRIIPSSHLTHPQQHPTVQHTDGSPRTMPGSHVATTEIVSQRSAVDHVTNRRIQFLPASLRGSAPATPHHIVATTGAPKTPPVAVMKENMVEDEEASTTVDSLNSQTEEEMLEASQRQRGRRVNRQHQSTMSRSLYPYLLNRMLG